MKTDLISREKLCLEAETCRETTADFIALIQEQPSISGAIKRSTRLCTVKGEHGYFHTWEHYSKPLPASPLVGGEPAGVFSQVFGIVEFKDGVRRVDPAAIIFCDEENAVLHHIDKPERIET